MMLLKLVFLCLFTFISVEHDNFGFSAGWFLDKVLLDGINFNSNWLMEMKGTGQILHATFECVLDVCVWRI